MTKIIWMSDPHFQNEGCVDGIDPRVRLDSAIAHANEHHSDAAFIVLSGDLVGDEMEPDYTALANHFATSDLPIHPMMGNHDDRRLLRNHLTVPPNPSGDFIHYAIEREAETIICLDTHKSGSHAGSLCASRLAWLDTVLCSDSHKPAYIFMHHPPLALELPMQDEIMLEDAEAFLDLVSAHPRVKHLFFGHVHRATSGSIRSIPFATLGSLLFQAPPPRPAWTWESFVPAKEAPQYGVLHITNGDVILHYTQFCDYCVGEVG